MCSYCVGSHHVTNAFIIYRPLIGGTFVDFASKSIDNIPHDGIRSIFERNPYLLPNIVTTVFALVICGLAVGVLDEVCRVSVLVVTCLLNTLQTLPAHRLKPSTQAIPASTSSDLLQPEDDEEPKEDETLSARHLFAIPIVRSICVSTFILGFLAAGFNTSVVLVAYTDVPHGGLSFTVSSLPPPSAPSFLTRPRRVATANRIRTLHHGWSFNIPQTQPHYNPSAFAQFWAIRI